jgi:hypothetical protein
MTAPAYPPARVVAPIAAAHFARHCVADAEAGEVPLAPTPDAATIEEIVSAAFWASLRREEGLSPTISIALLRPEEAGAPLVFGRRLRVNAATLAKLAPAVLRPGIHLGVWSEAGELYLWGATRSIPTDCFVLEVVQPGLLVIKRRRGPEGGKFANFVVLQGDEIKVVDESGGDVPECPPLLTGLLHLDSQQSWNDPVNTLVQLAASMRAHGRGGSLLVVPRQSDGWRESMVHPILYPVTPPFAELAELVVAAPEGEDGVLEYRESLRRAVDTVAGLTAVDGATVITDRYELLAFGAKISRRSDSGAVERVMVAEPVSGVRATIMEPSQLGGTRHLSAAQFAYDQRDALALVASQDGRFTAFAWSPSEEIVRAHRIESLLL